MEMGAKLPFFSLFFAVFLLHASVRFLLFTEKKRVWEGELSNCHNLFIF